MDVCKTLRPNFKLFSAVPFIVRVNNLAQLPSIKFPVDPSHLGRRNENTEAMELPFIEFANILVSVIEQLFSIGLKL